MSAAADDDPLGDLFDRESGIRGGHLLAGEDRRERCAPRRVSGLGERHRPHPQMNEAARARVPTDLISGDGGARQDELAFGLAIIDRVPDLVPQISLDLPLVEQAWGFALEK